MTFGEAQKGGAHAEVTALASTRISEREVVDAVCEISGLTDARHKFLECAVAGRTEYLVTGDKELRVLGTYRGVTILNAAEFPSLLGR